MKQAINNLHAAPLEGDLLDTAVRSALDQGELSMVYQPQFDVRLGRLVGFEALMRWNSPQLGNVPPNIFIPAAERCGVIEAMGEWSIRTALAGLARLQAARSGEGLLHMAVNVSALQIQNPRIVGVALDALRRVGLGVDNLHLELTETAVIANPDAAAATVAELDTAGIEVWIDDFGTGHASISMLRRLAVTGLKIDRSFVTHLKDMDGFCLVSAMIAMAQRLRLSVVTEGIETEEQLQVISQLGSDRVQGYLLGRPEPLNDHMRRW